MKTIRFNLLLILCVGYFGIVGVEAAKELNQNTSGSNSMPWKNRTPEKKAMLLEEYTNQIEYALRNLGKPFKDLDSKRIDITGYEKVGHVTYGLIAGYYCWCENYIKCAKYHYKDYLQALVCSKKMETIAPIPKDCWGGAPGDYDLMARVVDAYEMGGYYKEAVPYYKMWLDNQVKSIEGNTFEQKLINLKKLAKNDDSYREGVEVMKRWRKAKQLAKTTKPKPLDPAVQNHEWFYSDKQAEVLKALDYYYQNQVRFMLEKALNHKDSVIAAKAKEYLDKPGKADTDANDDKTP